MVNSMKLSTIWPEFLMNNKVSRIKIHICMASLPPKFSSSYALNCQTIWPDPFSYGHFYSLLSRISNNIINLLLVRLIPFHTQRQAWKVFFFNLATKESLTICNIIMWCDHTTNIGIIQVCIHRQINMGKVKTIIIF